MSDSSPVQLHIPISQWAAWSPHLVNREAWRNWKGDTEALGVGEDWPDVSFLPAMFRRRLSLLCRIALRVAYDCTNEKNVAECRTVFASRYGEQELTLELLKAVTTGESLSPTNFSVSVHNAASGLFSIAHKNRNPANAVSAMEHSFTAGFVDAMGQWLHEPETPVLLVMTDEPIPEIYSAYAQEPQTLYGVSFLISESADAQWLRVTMNIGVPKSILSPTAPYWLRWFLSGKGEFYDSLGNLWEFVS